jgi:hypothetical protein
MCESAEIRVSTVIIYLLCGVRMGYARSGA